MCSSDLDLQAVALALQAQLQESPGFFDQDPVLLDLDALPEDTALPDLSALCQLLVQHSLRPVAVKSARADAALAARQCGLVLGDDARVRRTLPESPAAEAAPLAAAEPAPALQEALVLDRPLRSGQQFYAKDRDLIVLATRTDTTAGARGILLGVALGTIATGLRLIAGMDRPYSE